MSLTIRRAENRDTDKVITLLNQVLELHAGIRPDIFIPGTTKYTPLELEKIFGNDDTPVFVAVDQNGEVVGYAFCVMKQQPFTTNMRDFRTLYIDDLCVDEGCRGQHVVGPGPGGGGKLARGADAGPERYLHEEPSPGQIAQIGTM